MRILISITDKKMFSQLGCELVTGPDVWKGRTAVICSYPQVEHEHAYPFSNVQIWLHIYWVPVGSSPWVEFLVLEGKIQRRCNVGVKNEWE